MFDKAYTMKKSWKFMRWEKRWEKRLDLTSSPKIYFCLIYTHYDEEVLTKHLRSLRWRNHDKTFTFITMKKSWQNIYDEIMTKHIRWRNHDKTCTFITMKKSWQNMYDEVMTNHLRWNHDKTCTMKSWQNIYVHVWQNIYEEVMTKHVRRRSLFPGLLSKCHVVTLFQRS